MVVEVSNTIDLSGAWDHNIGSSRGSYSNKLPLQNNSLQPIQLFVTCFNHIPKTDVLSGSLGFLCCRILKHDTEADISFGPDVVVEAQFGAAKGAVNKELAETKIR